MIEEVLHPSNMMRACRQVVKNKGSAGIDGMGVESLYDFFRSNREELENSMREGRYLPQPVLGVEIPKGGGKVRQLGIPTVLDRMLQQAVAQILCNHFETEFGEYSYGFRPNKNAHQAVRRSLEYINSGYGRIVDMDLKTFFDEVDHCVLLQLLYSKVKCDKTLRLIRKWLRAPVQIKGKLVKRRKGAPQGSPLSPVLSNILLNELDRELERWNVKYIRYADDFSIYCATEEEARRSGNYIYTFLRDKLHLPINREKSGIRRPEDFTVLGYGFHPLYKDGNIKGYELKVGDKSWKSLKEKLKTITRKTTSYSINTRTKKLKEVQRGWLQYFILARGYLCSHLEKVDKWVRSRLRYCYWHDWKKPDCRRKNLIRLGVNPYNARKQSNPHMSGWAVARSPILKTTITNAYLHQRGYESLVSVYRKTSPYLNEPLYTRPVRTVV